MGKYIVCGEAMVAGTVYQASCFETRIERLDNNSKLHQHQYQHTMQWCKYDGEVSLVSPLLAPC